MSLQKNLFAVRCFAKLMQFSAWLQRLPAQLTPPPFRLIQIGSSFWYSRSLYVAVQLNIADILGNNALSAEKIAEYAATNPDATARLLRLLCSIDIFTELEPNLFCNNKTSHFLRQNHPKNIRAMILMHNSAVMSHPWFQHLQQGITEGTSPFILSHGCSLFDCLDQSTEFSQLFSAAMDSVEALTGSSFATDFNWGRFDRIIDIGGSRGSKSLSILKHYPHLSALIVDQAHIIADAQHFWANQNQPGLERLQFTTGNLLECIPSASSKKDIYLLSAVLHGFDDQTCLLALKNLAEASKSHGVPIALMEMVMPESKPDVIHTSCDMQMFTGSSGKERTLSAWQSLFMQSDLHLEEIVHLRSFAKILVLRSRFSD